MREQFNHERANTTAKSASIYITPLIYRIFFRAEPVNEPVEHTGTKGR